MKARYFTTAAAIVLSLSLMGCSSGQVETTDPNQGTNPSAGLPYNDGMNGGGAGGTNDRDNDGIPDGVPEAGDHVGGDGRMGRIGGDIIDGAGDVANDIGNAINGAAHRAARALK